MESANLTDMNIDKIAALFPNCITETADENGKLKKAINFEMLRAMLSEDIAKGDEAYEFTWVGKKAAIAEANRPIRKTLRPCVEESVNWDSTENLYIEGDNLEVLKLLQESYLGKVKMIYIDPPYNTGNDFIYRDDFAVSADDYAEESGQLDEDGNRLFKNTDSNGRFHSDWCSMIYSRLMLARNLLSDDGVIFISIGQDEIQNMINLSNEVFGEDNHIGTVSRVMKSGGAQGQFFSPNIEYVAIYAKQITHTGCFREPISEEIIKKLYTGVETEGERKGEKFRPFGLYQSSLDPLRGCSNQRYGTDVFTEPTIKGKLNVNAMKAQKHLYNYIVYDSTNEYNFATELDTNKDVAVYVKLPNGFYISTPVGKYNPDWAIAFYEGTVKHIYFVAETKGSLESLEFGHISPLERAKIRCAEKHFKTISGNDVVYEVIDTYDKLLSIITK